MPDFSLQFPIEDVREYTSRYEYLDDIDVIGAGATARDRSTTCAMSS